MIPSTAPHSLRYSNTLCFAAPGKKKKKSILNKVETGFLLHPCKARFRARLNTFKPQGNDEIKHQCRVLNVRQEKEKKKKHSPCLLLHLGFYTCVSVGHSSTHPCAHTWVRGPAGSSKLIRCIWVKCQSPRDGRDSPQCFSPLLAVSSLYFLSSQQ